jgi:hypothetical protein
VDKTVSEFLLFTLGKIPTEIAEDVSMRAVCKRAIRGWEVL